MRIDASVEMLIETGFAAIRQQQPGIIIRIDAEDGSGLTAYVAKVSTSGLMHPAFSGFVASRGYDFLKAQGVQLSPEGDVRSGPIRLICIECGGWRRRGLPQYGFTQIHSEVLIGVVGDESGHALIEVILKAADEWRDGHSRLFDGAATVYDEAHKVTVRVRGRKPHGRFLRWLERVSMLITVLYAAWHLMYLMHILN